LASSKPLLHEIVAYNNLKQKTLIWHSNCVVTITFCIQQLIKNAVYNVY